MALRALGTPHVLLATECDHGDRPGKRTLSSRSRIEGETYFVRIRLIFVNHHNRPLSVRKLNWITGYQHMSGAILQIGGCREEPMSTSTVFDPFQVDDPAGLILRRVGVYVEVFVGYEVPVGAPAAAT